jgi:hypothetical protein
LNKHDSPRTGRGSFLSIAMDRGRSFMRLLQDDLRAFKAEELAAVQMVLDRRASLAPKDEVEAALQAVEQARASQAHVELQLADEGAVHVQAEAEDARRRAGAAEGAEKLAASPATRRTWRPYGRTRLSRVHLTA